MEKLIITGQRPLRGNVAISGSKNAAVALIAAALLAEDEVILENVPDIADIQNLIKIMKELQVKVRKPDRNTLCIDARGMVNCCLDSEPVHKMRASYYMLGGTFRPLPPCSRRLSRRLRLWLQATGLSYQGL